MTSDSPLKTGTIGGNPGTTVLIVEDDFANKYLCEALLRDAGFRVTSVSNCTEAKRILRRFRFSVVLLDLGLPDGDGMELLPELRPSQAALIMTVRGEPEQRARGLRSGAVDYIVKPFHPDELIWRVERARVYPDPRRLGTADHILWRGFALHPEHREFHAPGGGVIRLTAGETEILGRLLRRNTVVAREVLADAVSSGYGSGRSVSVLVSRLRRKLRATTGFEHIEILAIQGSGYHIQWTGSQ
ncbi:response regulator transcription factor [Pseudohaliea rubra]|uniref:Two-component system response regulator n=1 Tax=Pseudohaliea rubra DSM 19751 TaxID=1265313 RepID=A0A095X2Z2_9GAMM|nr:response regulator transcription factor [Pseudohaliea rubra]KGE05239.1 Two-component system response regulator [Pseudohaliea rubra DSM 19751]